jgi:hypothetical protein
MEPHPLTNPFVCLELPAGLSAAVLALKPSGFGVSGLWVPVPAALAGAWVVLALLGGRGE